MPLRVATWNLFHGRTQPATHADLLPAFAEALAASPWDVCGLQEVPSWWPAELGERLGASVRVSRTSLLRASLPGVQRRVHQRDPEVIGVRGAAVNVLLVRPSAGAIVDHRSVRLRRAPQRRTAHGVELARPGGGRAWVVNLHAHNRPVDAAARDVHLVLRTGLAWAGGAPLVVLGDLNLKAPAAAAVGRTLGFAHVHGNHVDQILAAGWPADPSVPAALSARDRFAGRMRLPGGGPALSDHRLVVATIEG